MMMNDTRRTHVLIYVCRCVDVQSEHCNIPCAHAQTHSNELINGFFNFIIYSFLMFKCSLVVSVKCHLLQSHCTPTTQYTTWHTKFSMHRRLLVRTLGVIELYGPRHFGYPIPVECVRTSWLRSRSLGAENELCQLTMDQSGHMRPEMIPCESGNRITHPNWLVHFDRL